MLEVVPEHVGGIVCGKADGSVRVRRSLIREGVNREKLTVKKIINSEILFTPFMSLINREKICVNREKIGTKNSPFFSPLAFHRLRPHD